MTTRISAKESVNQGIGWFKFSCYVSGLMTSLSVMHEAGLHIFSVTSTTRVIVQFLLWNYLLKVLLDAKHGEDRTSPSWLLHVPSVCHIC
jgi:hypothetical protein